MIRDNFSKTVALVAAQRAAYLCTNPSCRQLTIGPHSNEGKSLSAGVAAHICAAAPGGPRYDPLQSSRERKSIYNAIWLCHNCSDIVDKDEAIYTKELLHEWKKIHKEHIKQIRHKTQPVPLSRGGDGGEIHIIADTIVGNGLISADGGDGEIGGIGGKIHIQTHTNNYHGTISAKGGNSSKKVS